MKPLQIRVPSKEIRTQVSFVDTHNILCDTVAKTPGTTNFIMVTDTTIAKLFPDLFAQFPKKSVVRIPAGEAGKKWSSAEKILNAAFKNKLDRSNRFVAIGGGVVGDVTGFAAGIYLRGTPVIQVPTTLLSMVDASLGGKTAIDCEYGKNLIGMFHHPEQVICCQEFLDTLPTELKRQGLAEMIKHVVISGEKDFRKFEALDPSLPSADLWPLVRESMQVKINLVERDAHDHGKRMLLNLGHTFGHAVELLSEFSISHGDAVAIGTVMAAECAERNQLCDKKTVTRIRTLFQRFELPVICPFAPADVRRAMQHDKKRKNGHLQLVLPKKIGNVQVFSDENLKIF